MPLAVWWLPKNKNQQKCRLKKNNKPSNIFLNLHRMLHLAWWEAHMLVFLIRSMLPNHVLMERKHMECHYFQKQLANDFFEVDFVSNKEGCVFRMVVVFILPHAEFGPNGHREDALHFIIFLIVNHSCKHQLGRYHQLKQPIPFLLFW